MFSGSWVGGTELAITCNLAAWRSTLRPTLAAQLNVELSKVSSLVELGRLRNASLMPNCTLRHLAVI